METFYNRRIIRCLHSYNPPIASPKILYNEYCFLKGVLETLGCYCLLLTEPLAYLIHSKPVGNNRHITKSPSGARVKRNIYIYGQQKKKKKRKEAR